MAVVVSLDRRQVHWVQKWALVTVMKIMSGGINSALADFALVMGMVYELLLAGWSQCC